MQRPTLTSPTLFISDVHLGGFSENDNKRIESELIQLINFCHRKGIHIAILGDLFDYWMEYPASVPAIGKRILARFKEFNNALGPSLYITGNHDNWVHSHFKEMGFYVEPEQFIWVSNDSTWMALHGDGLADRQYSLPRPLIHRFLRNQRFIRVYQKLLSPEWGNRIMRYVAKFSRRWENEIEEINRLDKWAENQLQNTEIDLILSGHDHCPRRKDFSFGTYINLGTFYSHKTMAYYTNNSISLVQWVAATQSIQKFEKHS